MNASTPRERHERAPLARAARTPPFCDDGYMPVIAGAQRTEQIDVIAVDLEGHPDWNTWRAVPGKAIDTWEGERVSVVLNLVAALPESEGMRCFVPRYAIRLRCGPLVLTEVAFCFQCRNAMSVPIADEMQPSMWFTFDPNSQPAQDLLGLLQSCAE